METTEKIDDCIIHIKESGGKHQFPFTWFITDIDKTFTRQGEQAFLTKEECINDAKEYFYKYLNH